MDTAGAVELMIRPVEEKDDQDRLAHTICRVCGTNPDGSQTSLCGKTKKDWRMISNESVDCAVCLDLGKEHFPCRSGK